MIQWIGWTLFNNTKRVGAIRRSHGCWLAVRFDCRGQLSSGEYFSYGEPGALTAAKAWCERKPDRALGERETP